MNISVCIITKNELPKLKKCIEAIKRYPLEIVVVDTGSTDGTIEYLRENVDVVGDFVWCNDFSKARNYSITLASNDWILVLDTDEYIEKLDTQKLEQFIAESDEHTGRIERINEIKNGDKTELARERITRLFNRKLYKYKGRIHEQVVPINQEDNIDNYCGVPVSILHDGYVGADSDIRKKADRNIALLKEDLEEYGDDPYVLYQLGKSYFLIEEYDTAATYFEKAFYFDLNPKLEYVQDMVECYGYTLLELKRFGDMMILDSIYEEFAVSADYVLLAGLAYMNNGLFDRAIKEFIKATTMKYCKVEGSNSYKAFYNAGVVCECLGRKSEAKDYYKKCKDYEPALAGIRRIEQM